MRAQLRQCLSVGRMSVFPVHLHSTAANNARKPSVHCFVRGHVFVKEIGEAMVVIK